MVEKMTYGFFMVLNTIFYGWENDLIFEMVLNIFYGFEYDF